MSEFSNTLRQIAREIRECGDYDENCVGMHEEAADVIDALTDEVTKLNAWKAEALIILEKWEEAWVELGKPGGLGSWKPSSIVDLVKQLQADKSELVENLIEVVNEAEYYSGYTGYLADKWNVAEDIARYREIIEKHRDAL